MMVLIMKFIKIIILVAFGFLLLIACLRGLDLVFILFK